MTKTKGFLLAVAVAAMAFTFSCSSDDDSGGDPNPGGGVTVPADLQGVWKHTFTGGSNGSRTITFNANTYVYEQLYITATVNGVQYNNVKLKLTYTVTANKPATNTDDATDRAEFPSGYNLTEKLTDIENSHPAIQNSPTAAVGYEVTSSFYLNAAKDKFIGGYGSNGRSGTAFTKQE